MKGFHFYVENQEPLNTPFLNGLLSSGFSRGETAPLNGLLSGIPAMAENASSKRPIKRSMREDAPP